MRSLSSLLGAVTLGATLVFSGAIGSTAAAQPGVAGPGQPGPQARPHTRRGRMRRLANELELTEAQRARMRTLRQEGMTRARELRQSGDRAALRAHRQAMHERMRSVLTDAQRARAQELRRAQQQARLERRMTHLTTRLSLDPTQAQQVRGVLDHAGAQRRAIREQARLDQTPAREPMRALREQTRAQLASILSEEQMGQMRRMRRMHRGRRTGPGRHGVQGR